MARRGRKPTCLCGRCKKCMRRAYDQAVKAGVPPEDRPSSGYERRGGHGGNRNGGRKIGPKIVHGDERVSDSIHYANYFFVQVMPGHAHSSRSRRGMILVRELDRING